MVVCHKMHEYVHENLNPKVGKRKLFIASKGAQIGVQDNITCNSLSEQVRREDWISRKSTF